MSNFYYAKIVEDDDNNFIVTFPDFKNIKTYCETLQKALSSATSALNGALESDFFEFPKRTIISHQLGRIHYFKIFIEPNIIQMYYKREIKELRISKLKKSWWFVTNLFGFGSIPSTCWFSNKFWDVHDYHVSKGGDSTPSYFFKYNCSNCGKEFEI